MFGSKNRMMDGVPDGDLFIGLLETRAGWVRFEVDTAWGPHGTPMSIAFNPFLHFFGRLKSALAAQELFQ